MCTMSEIAAPQTGGALAGNKKAGTHARFPIRMLPD
jgi:hypothetical protein